MPVCWFTTGICDFKAGGKQRVCSLQVSDGKQNDLEMEGRALESQYVAVALTPDFTWSSLCLITFPCLSESQLVH